MVILNTTKAREQFGYSACFELADMLVCRLNDDIMNEEDTQVMLEADISALYLDSDQWEIIKAYCNPDDPRPFYECYNEFVCDILTCCEYVSDDEIDEDLEEGE